jgi:hypothetical protein
MSDSIQKIDLEARLKASETGWDNRIIANIMNIAFPPKYMPKLGQAVVISGPGPEFKMSAICFFMGLNESGDYTGQMYDDDGPVDYHCGNTCRCLTKEEFEGVSDD